MITIPFPLTRLLLPSTASLRNEKKDRLFFLHSQFYSQGHKMQLMRLTLIGFASSLLTLSLGAPLATSGTMAQRRDDRGRVIGHDPDGTYYMQHTDGREVTHHPDGSTTTAHLNGRLVTSYLNGVSSTQHVDGRIVTSHGNGLTATQHVDGRIVTDYPNGITTTLHRDGTRVDEHPNGSSVTHHPEGGSTIRPADGSRS